VEVSPVEIHLGLPAGGPPRSSGVHLSRIIRARAKEKGLLDGWISADLGLVELEGDSELWWESLDPASRLRISIGLAWEQWYIPQLGDVTDHPGEMHVDGVYMTHDGESLDVVMSPDDQRFRMALHEIKATYKSTKTVGNLSDQWLWLAQMKGYCKGLDTTVAYLHALFLCGNYKYPIEPQLKCWRVEFTQDEIDAEWAEMLGYVRLNRMMEQV
jgi:hypothetical protein